MGEEMEDTIIVRLAMPVQIHNSSRALLKRNPMEIIAVEDELPSRSPVIDTDNNTGVLLSDEDVAKLQRIFVRIEELEEHISYNSSWRQDAEADYLATRSRLMESESVCSSAVALANEAGQLSTSMGSRLAWFEIDLTLKGNQLVEQAIQLSSLENANHSMQQTVFGLAQQTEKLESLDILSKLAVLEKWCTELEE